MRITGLPSELELDALREIANIGCGNAATALSRMVGGKAVRIDMPRVLPARAEALLAAGEGDGRVVGAVLEIEGGVTGRMVLLWPENDARELVSLLGGIEEPDDAAEPKPSALAELANVVCSACLTGIATLTRLPLQPTPPRIIHGTGREILVDVLSDESGAPPPVVLEACFRATHVPPLSGRFFVVPDRAALPALLGAIGL